MNMRRLFTHLVIWLLGVPWAAGTLWLLLDDFAHSWTGDFRMIPGAILIALLGGLLGCMFCLVLTLPLALLLYAILTQFTNWVHLRSFRVGLMTITSSIGLLWAHFAARALNTGRSETALLIIGLGAGMLIGWLTLRLWTGAQNRLPER